MMLQCQAGRLAAGMSFLTYRNRMQARRARVKASAPYKMHGALVAEQARVRRASSAWQHSCCGAGSVMQALDVRKDASA